MKQRFSHFGENGGAPHSVRAVEEFIRAGLPRRRAEDCPPYPREASRKATSLRRFGILLFIFTCAGNLFAVDLTADFSAANKLYAEGQFAEAANDYENILRTGAQSPALWFNAGNAEFKSGRLGRAIASYRRAEQLSPRDAELHANLAFVRNQVQGATLRETRWQNLVGMLTLNEGALLTAALFWLTLGVFAIRQIRPALAPRLQTAARILVALTIFSATVLGLQATIHFSNGTAVVTAAEATARSGPFDEAQTAFMAHDGAEFLVLDRHDDWVQVADSSGKTGWLSGKQVEMLPGT